MLSKKDKQIKQLLYLSKLITERITNAIEEEVIRDRVSALQLEESLNYVIHDQINYLIKLGQEE